MSEEPVAITRDLLREWPLPAPGDSKNARGHVVVLGGAVTTPGAAMLAGLAALRVGAGVLAMAVPEEVAGAVAVAVPEASVTGWRSRSPDWTVLEPLLEQADGVVVGPGIDDPGIAESLVEHVARQDATWPVLLDAFALGVLHGSPRAADALADRLVLTPNKQEAKRLLDTVSDDESDAQVARRIARQWHATVSYNNTVATPGHDVVRHVPGNNPGLGTSGSGDVLAGAVVGLLTRGADLEQAACWGTYLHCESGARLAERIGPLGYLARELLDELPLALTGVTGH